MGLDLEWAKLITKWLVILIALVSGYMKYDHDVSGLEEEIKGYTVVLTATCKGG